MTFKQQIRSIEFQSQKMSIFYLLDFFQWFLDAKKQTFGAHQTLVFICTQK